MSDVDDLVNRLGQTALECRALIREMHEAQQDLKQTIRDAEEAKTRLDKYLTDGIEKSVAAQINILGEHTQKAMDDTSRKIIREFDRLSAPLMASLDNIKRHIREVRRDLEH